MKVDKSLEELQRDSAKMHRIVGQDPYSISIHMNIRPKYNHLPPLCSEDVSGTTKNSSKLWHLPVATHSGRTDGHCLDEFLISSFVHNDLTLDLCNVVWDMVTLTDVKENTKMTTFLMWWLLIFFWTWSWTILKKIVLVPVYIVIQHSIGHILQTNSKSLIAIFELELSYWRWDGKGKLFLKRSTSQSAFPCFEFAQYRTLKTTWKVYK